jgi:sec-independent protein translocase protein TatC
VTLIDHLSELRTRLFIALGAWIVASGVAFAFREQLLTWLTGPLDGAEAAGRVTVTTLQLLEPFLVTMQIAGFGGLVVASPIIVGQVWGFIAPGLYSHERRWAIPFVLLSVISLTGGILFGRYVVLPLALPILVGFLPGITALVSIGDYITKVLAYMAAFGVLFTMPVLGFLLARIGLVRAAFLSRHRRWSIVIGLIFAAVITPTIDPINFMLVAGPLVVLYELTIVVVRLSQRRVDHEREHPYVT